MEEAPWERAADKLRSFERLEAQEITPLATDLVAGLVTYCDEWVTRLPSATEKDKKFALLHVLPMCWGLMALDPHHAPFARLLNSMMGLVLPEYSGRPDALLVEHGKLPLLEEADPLKRAGLLVDQALDHSQEKEARPGAFLIEAFHLILTPANAEPTTRWLTELLTEDKGEDSRPWQWPAEGLALPHLLALSRASKALGNGFLGRNLGCLVAKAVVALCWSPRPPIDNTLWCEECVELLLIRFGGGDPSDLDRKSVVDDLPHQIRTGFEEGEKALYTDDDDDDDSETDDPEEMEAYCTSAEEEEEMEMEVETTPGTVEGAGGMSDPSPTRIELEQQRQAPFRAGQEVEQKEQSLVEQILANVGSYQSAEATVKGLLGQLPAMSSDQRQIVRLALTHAILKDARKSYQQLGNNSPQEWKSLVQQLWRDDMSSGMAAAFRAALACHCIRGRDHSSESASLLLRDSPIGDLRVDPDHWAALLAGELALESLAKDVVAKLRFMNALLLRSMGSGAWLFGASVPPLQDRRGIVARLHAYIAESSELSQALVEALSPEEWLGVVTWQQPKWLSVRHGLDRESPYPLGSAGQVELSLQQTIVRHVTSNQSLLAMIREAVASGFLEFKARSLHDQYTGVGLAWFGIDPSSIPADTREYDGLLAARYELRDNCYGCAVLSFPLSTLLSDKPSLWQLGERDYKNELSQTVLVDPTGGPVAIYEGDKKTMSLQKAVECDGNTLKWPYNIYCRPRRWMHPEIAVQGGFRIHPHQGLRVTFEPHGNGICVKTIRRQYCLDCARGVKETKEQARDGFLATVREGGLPAVIDVLQFLRAWPTAFADADREVLAAAMLPLLPQGAPSAQ